jgi:hypothetical protein
LEQKQNIELTYMSHIFEQPNSLFPHSVSHTTWHFSIGENFVHLSDGTHTYSFVGQLGGAELKKMPDVPLPDFFNHAKSKGKAQVHRSDPSSIHFTIQDGQKNPTYTVTHKGSDIWTVYHKDQERESRDTTLVIQELIATDPIISKFPTWICDEAIQELLRLAPELCSDKELVRAFLRQAGGRRQIDESQANALIAQNLQLLALQRKIEADER